MRKNILSLKHHYELTDDDWEFLIENKIINGCGGNIRAYEYDNFFRKIFYKIADSLAKILCPIFFMASCKIHDFGYWVGWSEERRKECDQKFLEKILEDIELQNFKILQKIFYTILAYAFYYAVRIGGKQFFNYY